MLAIMQADQSKSGADRLRRRTIDATPDDRAFPG